MKFYFKELQIHYSSLIKEIESLINKIKENNEDELSALDDFMHAQFISGMLNATSLPNYKLVTYHQGHQELYVNVYSNNVFICQFIFIATINFPVVKGKKFKRNRLVEYTLYAIFISKYNKLECLNIFYEFHECQNCLILEDNNEKNRAVMVFDFFSLECSKNEKMDVFSMKEYNFINFCKSLKRAQLSRLCLALFEDKQFTEEEKEAIELSHDIYFKDIDIKEYSINIEEIKNNFKFT